MQPAYLQQLLAIAERASSAGHGDKEMIYRKACQQLNKSRATLLKDLKRVQVNAPRKRRTDAGLVELTYADACFISAWMMEGYRKNDRRITSLKETLKVLRADNPLLARVLDESTGELRYLSASAVARGLRAYTLHPDQLRQATPHTNLQSLHPNHVWQVDASVCVVYYLPDDHAALVELDQAVHYKNKPENLKAIEQYRVIRYVLVDHCSGVIRYRYYPHAESGQHTVEFIAWAMAQKTGDPFHGAPFMIMVDPGATSGGLVKRFCARVSIELIVNKVKNARAKGSVEKANHIVETTFEQALRYMDKRPANFDEINALADKYQHWFNMTQIHSRTQRTRYEVWALITPEQLRITPTQAVLLSLATEEPIKRKVKGDLTAEFKKRIWDVADVPGILVKGDVYLHWHPFIPDTAMAVVWGEDGQEQHIALPEIKKNDFGFLENAAVIGLEHKAKADTLADTHRKQLQKLSAGTDTLEAAEKARAKAHFKPFNGAIDPFKHTQGPLPELLPKQGKTLDVAIPSERLLKNNEVQMARWLKGRLGDRYEHAMLHDLQKRFPEGATDAELEQVLADLNAGRAATGKAKLQAV